jgi:hypothetical protein
MTPNETTLYPLGFIRTQPNYYETPLNKQLVVITDNQTADLYSTVNDELTPLETFSLTDCPYTDYTLVNKYRTVTV